MTELEAALAALVRDHDREWDRLTEHGLLRSMQVDSETLYHWRAADCCEAVLEDLRGPRYRV